MRYFIRRWLLGRLYHAAVRKLTGRDQRHCKWCGRAKEMLSADPDRMCLECWAWWTGQAGQDA